MTDTNNQCKVLGTIDPETLRQRQARSHIQRVDRRNAMRRQKSNRAFYNRG